MKMVIFHSYVSLQEGTKPDVQQKWRSILSHEVLELKNRGPAYIIEAGDRWVDGLMDGGRLGDKTTKTSGFQRSLGMS